MIDELGIACIEGYHRARVSRGVQTALNAIYVMAVPVFLIGVFIGGFVWLAEIEEHDGDLFLTVYGSPVNTLFAGAASGPLVLLVYLVYWLVRFLWSGRKQSQSSR